MASPSKIANGKPEQAAQADAEQPQTETTSDQKKSNSNVPNSTNNSNNSGSSDCPNPKSANDEKTHRPSPQSQPQQQQQQPQQQQQQQQQQPQQQQQQQPQAPTVFRIPSYCSWFSMDRFHSTEQRLLPEFFDGRSPSKTPRVYKDLRDFIINKYRENPQRKINFTEVRKMLVGDVNSVRRVYDFLENWGLVNYQATAKKHGRVDEETEAGNKNSGSAERAAAADAKKDFPRKVLCNLCGVNCATVRFDSLKGLPEGVNTKSGDESGSKDPGISSLTNDPNVDGQQEMDNETSKLGTKLQKVQKNDEKGKEEIEQNEVKEKLSKQSEKLLRCPRCDSLGTKFCYYNNYDLNQPRHFCKNCQRYWTVGGTMRNVPIGAGRRKGKQATPYYWYAMKPVSAIVAKGDGSDPPCPQVGFVLCAACYAHGNFGPGLSASDYKRVEMKDTSQHKGIEWSDQELLLLLEGLLRHGDDWKSVAQYVGTKSEVDCVTKFLQLPLGEQYLNDDISDRISSSFTGESAVPSQSFRDSFTLEHEQGSWDDKHCPPDDMNLHLIQRCLTPFADADNPTIAQVSFLSAIAGPNVVEAAARAAVDAVGQEPTEFLNLFAEEEDISKPEKDASASEQCIEKGEVDGDKQESCETMMIDAKNEGADIIAEINGDINQCTDHEKERTFMHKKKVAIAKDIRSAALLAKSQIDEEYRNVELTYSSIIENEVKRLHEKVEHFDRMDKISEREKSQLEQIKQFVVAERIRLSQEAAKSSQIARRDSKGTHSGILQ